MHVHEDLDLTGRLTICRTTPDGRRTRAVRVPNAITRHGRQLVARLFNHDKTGDPIQRVSKMQVGSSGKAFDPADEALGSPIEDPIDVQQIEEIEITDPTTGRPRVMLRLTAELGEDDHIGELREAGLFTDDGLMYNRVVFDTITKSDQFKLTLIWEITF